MKPHRQRETSHGMRLDYLMAASWYWFRAEGPDENLVSALNRKRAAEMAGRCLSLGVELPADEEIRAYAVDRWPSHKVHQGAV